MEKKRDAFKSGTGFVIACIGSAVGMGNIWRFPYMVSDWGGMTFLLPYVLFVILIASTGLIEEMALGRAAKGGPIKAFGKCTEIRTGNKKTGEAIGVLPVLGSLALAIGYTVVVGWIFKYAFLALVKAYLNARDKGLTQCALLSVDTKENDRDEVGKRLIKLLRQSDYVGELEGGKMYALLANTSAKDATMVKERFEKEGVSCQIQEDVFV